MGFDAGVCQVRSWNDLDVSRLATIANDIRVSRYLRQAFPHPYTLDDAKDWIKLATSQDPLTHFAIETKCMLVGGIGISVRQGECSGVGEIGYWLGHGYWAHGITTAAVRCMLPFGFEKLGLKRLEALVMSANTASIHVLERCGFRLEAKMLQIYVDRLGTVHDGVMYRMTRNEFESS